MLQTLKKFLLALVSIFLFSVFATPVLALPGNVTGINLEYNEIGNTILANLTNGSISYNNQINLTFVLNATASNVSLYLANGTFVNLTHFNSNQSWTNSSPFTLGPNGNGSRAFNLLINSTYPNTIWANGSANEWIINFTVNEIAKNGITVNLYAMGNDTVEIFNTPSPKLNVSMNTTVSRCDLRSPTTNTTTQSMRNYTSNYNFTNTSRTDTLAANGYVTRNLTVSCEDAFGNVSWGNTS